MLEEITMSLPFPPTINTYYAVVRGRKILSAKGREYKERCSKILLFDEYVMVGPVAVQIILTMPDKRRRDIDNYIKPVLDVLTENKIYEDDSNIQALFIGKAQPNLGPGEAEVTISYFNESKDTEKPKIVPDNVIPFPGGYSFENV